MASEHRFSSSQILIRGTLPRRRAIRGRSTCAVGPESQLISAQVTAKWLETGRNRSKTSAIPTRRRVGVVEPRLIYEETMADISHPLLRPAHLSPRAGFVLAKRRQKAQYVHESKYSASASSFCSNGGISYLVQGLPSSPGRGLEVRAELFVHWPDWS